MQFFFTTLPMPLNSNKRASSIAHVNWFSGGLIFIPYRWTTRCISEGNSHRTSSARCPSTLGGWTKKKVSNASPGRRFPIHRPGLKERHFGASTRKPVPSWIGRFNQIIQMTKMHFDVRQTSDDGALGNHETMQHSISVSAMGYDGTWLWEVLRKIGLFWMFNLCVFFYDSFVLILFSINFDVSQEVTPLCKIYPLQVEPK